MKLNVLICDDDIIFVNKLKTDINNYFKISSQDIVIVEKSKDFLNIRIEKYNIIFMDIDLSNERIDGISLASQLKKENPGSLIVFTSARNELVFRTFKVGGFQFIRKNHYQHDFDETMQQIFDYIKKKHVICFIDNWRKKEKGFYA